MADDYKDKDTFLARWLNGTLSEEEKNSIKDKDDFEDLQKILSEVDKMELPPMDKQKSFAAFKKAKNNASSPPTKEAKVRRMGILPIAAAAAILLLVGFFMFKPTGDAWVEHNTLAHENKKIELPDGSTIELSHHSMAKWNDSDAWKKNRVVEMEGEAFFEVKKGSSFQVETEQGIVTVLGTSFNIYNYKDRFEVSCYTGKVEVKSTSHIPVILTQGKMTRWSKNGFEIKDFNADSPTDWSENKSQFVAVPLSRVLEEMEIQFEIKFDVTSIDATSLFTGTYLHKNLDTALKMVLEPMNLTGQKNGNIITLSEKD